MKRCLAAVFILAIALCGCVTPKGYFNLVTTTGPDVSASVTTQTVGDPVTVTVDATVSLSDLSEREAVPHFYGLGVCVVVGAPPVSEDACSLEEKFVLPEGLTLTGDDSLSVDGEVVVARGTTIPISHSVPFTATEPEVLTVVGVLLSMGAEGGVGGVILSDAEARATIEFR